MAPKLTSYDAANSAVDALIRERCEELRTALRELLPEWSRTHTGSKYNDLKNEFAMELGSGWEQGVFAHLEDGYSIDALGELMAVYSLVTGHMPELKLILKR